MKREIISLQEVTFTYTEEDESMRPAVDDVSLYSL